MIPALHAVGRAVFKDDGGIAQTGDARPLEQTDAVGDCGNVHAAECHGSPVVNGDVRLRAARSANFVSVNQLYFFGICCDFLYISRPPSCIERYVAIAQIDDGLPVAIVCTRAIGFGIPALKFVTFTGERVSVQGLRRVRYKLLRIHRSLAAVGIERHSVGCPIRRIIGE